MSITSVTSFHKYSLEWSIITCCVIPSFYVVPATCLPCHSSCLRCSSPDPGSCTACATGFFMLLITDGEGKCIPLEMVHSQEQSTADRVIDLSDRLFILVVTLATSLIFVVLVLLLCFHYRLRVSPAPLPATSYTASCQAMPIYKRGIENTFIFSPPPHIFFCFCFWSDSSFWYTCVCVGI